MSQGIEFTDDQNIKNDAELWRRIHRDFIKPDKNMNGALRPSSQAFQNYPRTLTMSVYLADIVREDERDAEDIIAGYDGYALASISAGLARECEQAVMPAPEDNEPAHFHVCGEKPNRIKKKLAKNSAWVIEPSV
jgi:hypothetical protein